MKEKGGRSVTLCDASRVGGEEADASGVAGGYGRQSLHALTRAHPLAPER